MTRPGPPASPRPDGLFDSRTEPYKKAEQKKKHLPYKKAGAFGDPYGESPAPCGTVRRTVPPGWDRRLRRGRTGCSIPVQSLTKRRNKRKSTCLTRKQVLLVTRTGISRALWNSPQDCPTRPGPPASPRPDGLFDSRTETYKKAEQKKKHLPYKKAGAFGGCGKGFSPDPYGNLPRAKKQSTGLFFAHCGAPPCSIPRTEAKNAPSA